MLAKFFKKNKKVFVGMSGGVDSSVAALILKERGYDVVGVFIKTWQPDYIECTWKEDRLDAMRVAAKLEIPFITLDLEKEYKKNVIDYLLNEYKSNRVPNPDIFCNKYIKFGAFVDYAFKNGADYVATGHYAKIKNAKIIESEDRTKDQTYFLYQIKKEYLDRILFPLGDINKKDVRTIAKKANLATSEKKDSQGICMLGDISIKDFLKKELNIQEGVVVNENGDMIGTHDGVELYTIGERHGFEIKVKSTEDKPYFVIDKDQKTNTLTVSNNKPTVNQSHTIKITDTNWFADLDDAEDEVYVKLRYRGKSFKSTLNIAENTFRLKENADQAVSGQSAVFYNLRGELIGGGIIE